MVDNDKDDEAGLRYEWETDESDLEDLIDMSMESWPLATAWSMEQFVDNVECAMICVYQDDFLVAYAIIEKVSAGAGKPSLHLMHVAGEPNLFHGLFARVIQSSNASKIWVEVGYNEVVYLNALNSAGMKVVSDCDGAYKLEFGKKKGIGMRKSTRLKKFPFKQK